MTYERLSTLKDNFQGTYDNRTLTHSVLRNQTKKSNTNSVPAEISPGAKYNLYINHPKMVRIWFNGCKLSCFCPYVQLRKKQRNQIWSPNQSHRMPSFYLSYLHLSHANNSHMWHSWRLSFH